MDIQQRKFRLAFAILAAGMLVAYAWFGFEWLMGNDYPYNTFLFLPQIRFSDLTDTIRAATQPDPYLTSSSLYPPTAFALFGLFQWVPMPVSVFLIMGILPITGLLFHVMRPVFIDFSQSILGHLFSSKKSRFGKIYLFVVDNIIGIAWAVLLLIVCEPFVFCLDRGNIELWVILMVAASLYCFSRGRFYASVAWLIIPICLKMYPAVLLVLFVRRHKIHLIALAFFAVLTITIFSYSCFSGGIMGNYLLERHNMEMATEQYLIENAGLSETSSPWNLYRAMVITGNAIQTGTFFDSRWNWYPLIPHFRAALAIYSYCVVVIGFLVAVYSVLVEKEVLRRFVFLLLFMVLASPAGAEYKITHIGSALVALILIPTYRRGDFWVLALLAFTLIPKKEYLFECFGPTDSGFSDVPCSIILNPLAMLIALGILAWSGLSKLDLKWSRLRFRGLLPAWMFKSYRFRWIG